MMPRTARITVFMAMLLGWACGSSDFSATAPREAAANKRSLEASSPHRPDDETPFAAPQGGDAGPESSVFGLSWSCMQEKLSVEVQVESESRDAATIAGELCPEVLARRDVVFVVDVSGSMERSLLQRGNDPVRRGSCGRRDAILALVAAASPETRFALVTFSGAPIVVSEDFLDPATFLEEYGATNVLCAADGGTNYGEGLGAALPLVDKARPDAAFETYFLSDGYPDDDDFGRDEAELLKRRGVLATLMLRGDESILRDELASRDQNGEPWHAYVAEAKDLATELAALASLPTYTEASLKLYADANGDAALLYEEELSAAATAFGPFELSFEKGAVQGFRLEIWYVDSFGRQFKQEGRVTL